MNWAILRGRGQLGINDRILALAPEPLPPDYTARYSNTMELYFTSAAPTETGLAADVISQPGVQNPTCLTQ